MAYLEIFPKVVGKYRMPQNGIDDIKQKSIEILHRIHRQVDLAVVTGSKPENLQINGHDEKLWHYFNEAKQSLLDEPGFERFESWIKDCCLDYINNVMGCSCEGVYITDCWLNKCDAGGSQFMHTHGNSFLSGTYYVNFDRTKHAQLAFQNRDFLTENSILPYMELPVHEFNKYNSGGALIDHDEGDLLLWYSNMVHGYDRNGADNRVSISFNVLPERFSSGGTYSFKVVRERNE